MRGRDFGSYLSAILAVGGRIMQLTRGHLFAAPKLVRPAEERLERGRVAVSAARVHATNIAQQSGSAAQVAPQWITGTPPREIDGVGMGSAMSSPTASD
jgi:hypothetical protein